MTHNPAHPAGGAGAVKVPDGWALVPIEPTPLMHAASEREWDGRMSARTRGVWRAMISAAPTPPVPEPEAEGEAVAWLDAETDIARAETAANVDRWAKSLPGLVPPSSEAEIADLRAKLDAAELKVRGADSVVAAIERAIPDWWNYRDLIDAVECKLAEGRS